MSIQAVIEQKLLDSIKPEYLHVENESSNHNVPPGSESHFKVIIVSDEFTDKTLVARHRLVNQTLKEELQNKIHALALHTFTNQEWSDKQGNAADSPPCMGGSKT